MESAGGEEALAGWGEIGKQDITALLTPAASAPGSNPPSPAAA